MSNTAPPVIIFLAWRQSWQTANCITTGVQTRKGVVGYDLTNLLVGSEGTLGIITSLTLKLIAKPAATKGMMCVFNDMVSAMNCVAAIMGQGYLPSAIEFLDHRCLSLIGELLPFSPACRANHPS